MASFAPSTVPSLARQWRSSLTFRVVTTTLIAAIVVLLGGGYMVMDKARRGIMEAKTASAGAQAGATLRRMQNQLNSTDLRTESLLERLGQLAEETSAAPTQYSVVIYTPATIYVSGGVKPESVPEDLREQLLLEPNSLWSQATQISYADADPNPGVAVGGYLTAPSGQRYAVFFLFSAESEHETLMVLRRALWSTGAVLTVAMALVAYAVARQVATPVKEAQETASLIAEGDLDQRLPVRGSDELAGLAIAMNHMASTLQDQITQLEDLSRVQRQFVSDVSHELRTPLTTMRMATDVLYDSRDDFEPVDARTTELLHDEIGRFETMLNDLLEISRFDAGAAVLNVDDVDLVYLVGQQVASHTLVAQATGSVITLNHSGPVHVEADATRLRRILNNLLGNAVAHGEGKPIEVEVAADETTAAVTVRDHGVGLSPEQVDKVFIRFWRADESRNRIIGGTGLGLAIAVEDARLHGGWLEAWGSLGRGACFRLTVPLRAGESVDHSPLPLIPVPQQPALPGVDEGTERTAADDHDALPAEPSDLADDATLAEGSQTREGVPDETDVGPGTADIPLPFEEILEGASVSPEQSHADGPVDDHIEELAGEPAGESDEPSREVPDA